MKMSMETAPASQKAEKTTSEEKISRNTLVLAGAVLLGSLIVAGAITMGGNVKKGEANPPAPDQAGEEDTTATTNLDGDPTLGTVGETKVAIVEFSDYECPFCKRFHDETYADLVKEYVESGKATYTFRDYPLSFHEPNASLAAGVASCIEKAKGDAAYFAFSQAYFEGTVSNGKGVTVAALDTMIRATGADPKSVRACADTQEVKDEIAKDIADGGAAGVSGTPSFVIGTVDADGRVTGELLVGAVPLSGFKTVIDKYLAQ